MDMSDKVVAAAGADELERDREQLRAESRVPGAAYGRGSVSSIGYKLKLMFGAAAAASGLLGVLAIGALATSGAATSGLLIAMVVVALGTAAMAVLSRVSTNDRPRVHIIPDMDFQEKFKAQRENPFFADGRAMRLDVAGTVAQGELRDDDHFYRGKVNGAFAKTFPEQVAISMETMEAGRETFGIYCAPCHGVDGAGQGMIHQRARALLQGTWVPPTNLHQENLLYKPVGELFDNISRGVRNMPPYAHQIDTSDRWAVVLYLRALQRSRAAKLDDLPEGERGGLK